jgi:LuxR family transcriptional regulator, maltose regulon positive regulatory protein
MVDSRGIIAPAALRPLSEEDLAASCLALLARPSLWESLSLPPATRASAETRPWATYWAARLDTSLDVLEARALLTAARESFRRHHNPIGEWLCLAAIIEGFYIDEGPLDPLDGWIAALQSSLPDNGAWPSAELEARVIACGVGILLRDQAHPLLAQWAQRGPALMRQLQPGAGRLKLATFLAQYHLWRGEFSLTAVIVDALPGLDMAGLLPAEALVWLETVANHARCAAEPARGQAAVEAALQLVRKHGLRQHRYALHAHGAALALAAQDAPAARIHLEAMRPVLDGGVQADQTHYWHFLAGLSLLEGDTARAVELARTALGNSDEIGGPYRGAIHLLSLGQAQLRAGEPGAALENLDRAHALAAQIDAGLLAFSAAMMRAAALLVLGRAPEAHETLVIALADGVRRDFRTLAGWWMPDVVARLAQFAIEHDIEVAYVSRLVRRHRLAGPDPALAAWPWPLVLHGFGRFEARCHEQSLTHTGGKTAQRPLDLLRALLAHGPSPLPVATAMNWLWPEADPAAQRKAFDVALLRLRRLLDDPRLVRLEGGHLSLDERWAWSDVGALHALMQRIGSAHGAPLSQLQQWGSQLLRLMRGPFLVGEDADWVQGARQRYLQRFVITVAQLAAHMEPLDSGASIQLYERALDIEPLAETLSRRLMQLHASRGDRAEALRAWRACSTMLRVSAGLQPSAETTRLATALGLLVAVDGSHAHP